MSAGLLVAFVVYTLLVVNWGPFIRLDLYLNRNYHVHPLWPVLHVLDRIGQRAVCVPILAVVAAGMSWWQRSWRPVLLAVIAVFAVNLVVLIVKLALSRGAPLSGQSFFADGDLYPSGHTANIMVVYGLCYHLVTYYGNVSTRIRRCLIGLLCVLSVSMFTTSLLLRWHWFSDLIGGFLLGGAVLALLVGVDSAVPFRSRRLVIEPAGHSDPPPSEQPAAEQPGAEQPASREPVAHATSAPSPAASSVTRRRRLHGSPSGAADHPSRH